VLIPNDTHSGAQWERVFVSSTLFSTEREGLLLGRWCGRRLKHFVVLMNGDHPAASIASARAGSMSKHLGGPKRRSYSLKLLLVAILGTNDLDLHVGEQRRHRSYSS
jgi:hypothetical protein